MALNDDMSLDFSKTIERQNTKYEISSTRSNISQLPTEKQEIIDILRYRNVQYHRRKAVDFTNPTITPQTRKEQEIDKLLPLISKIQFFKDKKMTEEDLRFVCKKLKYEYVPQGYDVISYGDQGDKFYITLSGTLGVYYPANKISNDHMRSLGLDERMLSLLRMKLKRQEGEEFELPPNRILNRRRQGHIHRAEQKNNNSMETLVKQVEALKKKYKQVAILPEECSFGELALISDQPRASTIRAETDAYFAVLEKDDFNKILGAMSKKVLTQKVDFLKGLPIFRTWSKESLEKISYFFKQK